MATTDPSVVARRNAATRETVERARPQLRRAAQLHAETDRDIAKLRLSKTRLAPDPHAGSRPAPPAVRGAHRPAWCRRPAGPGTTPRP